MKKTLLFLTFAFALTFLPLCVHAESQKAGTPQPPGTIIAASPDWENIYYGTPSMEIMPDGTYVFTHDWFGPGTSGELTCVYQSHDRGATWEKVSEFKDQKSGSIFRIGNALYHIGFYRPGVKGMSNECIAIRRSDDMGKTWTVPTDAAHGLLCSDDRYYSDPVPVLIHNGRIYWQVDRVDASRKDWPPFHSLVISAPTDGDLLNAENWTRSSDAVWEKIWPYRGWLEGNCVACPDGSVSVFMRVEDWGAPDGPGRHVARLNLSPDGKELKFSHFLTKFPGGHSKFCIRYDEVSKKYWALTNWMQPGRGARNTLTLVCSEDLENWEIRQIVYQHTDGQTGLQYVDWRIAGDDIDFVCRVGWYGKNFHDSNYMVFDRVKNFRTTTRENDAPLLPTPEK